MFGLSILLLDSHVWRWSFETGDVMVCFVLQQHEATPQNNQKPVGPEEPCNQETQPATESQLLQYQQTMKVASSPARSRVTAKSSIGEGASSPPVFWL